MHKLLILSILVALVASSALPDRQKRHISDALDHIGDAADSFQHKMKRVFDRESHHIGRAASHAVDEVEHAGDHFMHGMRSFFSKVW